jgi:hypothetical protein
MFSLLFPRSAKASNDAAEDRKKEQGANSSTEANNKRFVIIYPGFHFSANRTSFALTLRSC